jgi:hypothetical protein
MEGARLAVRIMLYASTLGATLRIYGDGDERESIVKASQRWEVADRASVVPRAPSFCRDVGFSRI